MKNQIKEKLKSHFRELYWLFYRKRIKFPLLRPSSRSFLFVCNGNICRSPFAEYLARKMANEKGLFDLRFESAGIEVGNEIPPPQIAKEVALEYGIDLSGHLSKSINKINLKNFDMIISMQFNHTKRMWNLFPDLRERIYLLPYFQPPTWGLKNNYFRFNIPDPYGKEREEFVNCFERIKLCLEMLMANFSR